MMASLTATVFCNHLQNFSSLVFLSGNFAIRGTTRNLRANGTWMEKQLNQCFNKLILTL